MVSVDSRRKLSAKKPNQLNVQKLSQNNNKLLVIFFVLIFVFGRRNDRFRYQVLLFIVHFVHQNPSSIQIFLTYLNKYTILHTRCPWEYVRHPFDAHARASVTCAVEA